MTEENQANKIKVSGINIAWDSKRGTCTFENLPVAMMWVDTTLTGLMSGTQAMVGTKRFGLALQSEGRKSVEADWNVISQFSDFRDGFKAIANIAAVAGWGDWDVLSLDMEKKECLFRIRDSWEGLYQKALGVCWGSSMVAGKMAGYCSRLFETNCWAEQSGFIAKGDEYDEFVVRPSERSIEQESENLLATDEATRADLAVALEKLQKEVAERKQTELALRNSEAQLSNAMEIAQLGYWEYDVAKNIFTFNDQFYSIFRTSAEKIGGYEMTPDRYAHVFVHPDDMSVVDEEMRKALETTDPNYNRQLEHRIIYADGETGYITVRFFIVKDDHGRTVKTYGANQDITARKKAEEEKRRLEGQLQRAEKMEAIGILAGGVAHDLNNVLGGLVSYPDLMLIDLPEDSPLREPILTIQTSGKKAAAIVQDLLTLARRGVAVNEVTNLNDVINEYLKSPEYKTLKSFYPYVQVEANLETDLLNVLASPVHLSKTIMNLVSNAAEASSDAGTINISTINQYIDKPIRGYDEVKEGDYIALTVADDGMGIAATDLERIFEPFYTKKVMGRSGTGLGMAVVWGTVKDHDGYIHVESTEGKGTTFTLYFPVTREEAEKEGSVSLEACMGNGQRVLVVDDVKEQRQIATMLLTKLGYSVNAVSSGEKAIEHIKTNAHDLLILDMIMDPGIDGLDTYKKIIENHPGQKAVIASGFSETDRVKETQKLGAGQYVKKPYTLEKIGLAVKAELSR